MNENGASAPCLVVGVDFSEGAGCALREARRLGALLQARLTLVHVLPGSFMAPWSPDDEASAWLERASVADVEIDTRAGRAWSELARAAQEQDATALVIGSHGISGYQPLTLGSTAARLTLVASCPVLIVSPRSAADRQRPSGSHRVVHF